MVVPPDPNKPPTTSAHDGDLTLNGATSSSDIDAAQDLRLAPEVDSSSFLEEFPLERRDTVPPDASTPERSHVDIFITEEADRSWLSRLRWLTTPWAKAHPRPPAPKDPVRSGPVKSSNVASIERTNRVAAHLASLTELRAGYASIHQRLARIEGASGHEDEAPALHALCSQMSDRLVRVEAAVQHTEGFAESRLPEMCDNIENQLVQARMALQRTEDALADKTLHELCRNIDARLARSEDAHQRSEEVVARQLEELSGRMTARFEDIEDMLRRTPKLHDSIVRKIEGQLIQSRMPLQRIEDAVADKTLHEICRNIDAGIERLESRLHRSDALVAERLQELDARVTARLAESEERIQRIERVVSSRADLPFVAHTTPRSATPVDGGGLTRRIRFGNIKPMIRPVQMPWMARLVVPALVLVIAMAIPALIRTDRAAPPEKVVPLSTTDHISTSVVRTTNQVIRTPSSAATVMANAPRSTGESRISPPPQRSPGRASPERVSPERVSAPVTTRGPRFVGTLSITSVPSGASVSINGKPVGVTPLKLTRQRAGSHAVQIAHEGFERWSSSVVVPADRVTQVSAELRATAR